MLLVSSLPELGGFNDELAAGGRILVFPLVSSFQGYLGVLELLRQSIGVL